MFDRFGFDRFRGFVWTALLVIGFCGSSVFAQTSREILLIEKLGKVANPDEDIPVTTENAEVRVSAYEAKFQKVAQKVAAAMARKANGAEVEKLRAQAIAIIKRPNLSKDMVKTELDPIMDKLNAMILPTRNDVYAADARLSTLRNRLTGQNLEASETTAILYALTPSSTGRNAIVKNFKLRKELSKDEAEGIDMTNRLRLVLGLSALEIDMKLVEAGRDHSKDMATLNFFAHQSPVKGKTTPWDRAKNFGTTASGENIAKGYRSGTAAVEGWYYSPGHLKNLMNAGHRRIAIGQHGVLWTQLFGR